MAILAAQLVSIRTVAVSRLNKLLEHRDETAMKIAVLCVGLSAALPVMAQTPTASQSITATIDASKTGAPISPYVYGQFLEHIGGLIYGSLWSEMLNDRKFYNITGAGLSGKGTLWRLASAESNGQNPKISSSPVDSVPDSLTLPPFSVSIYELPVR
jgi:hypothetical protein